MQDLEFNLLSLRGGLMVGGLGSEVILWSEVRGGSEYTGPDSKGRVVWTFSLDEVSRWGGGPSGVRWACVCCDGADLITVDLCNSKWLYCVCEHSARGTKPTSRTVPSVSSPASPRGGVFPHQRIYNQPHKYHKASSKENSHLIWSLLFPSFIRLPPLHISSSLNLKTWNEERRTEAAG